MSIVTIKNEDFLNYSDKHTGLTIFNCEYIILISHIKRKKSFLISIVTFTYSYTFVTLIIKIQILLIITIILIIEVLDRSLQSTCVATLPIFELDTIRWS